MRQKIKNKILDFLVGGINLEKRVGRVTFICILFGVSLASYNLSGMLFNNIPFYWGKIVYQVYALVLYFLILGQIIEEYGK